MVKKRILAYDLIRITAIFMVVMIHCAMPFLKVWLPPSGGFAWANLFDSISRAGPPLFFMLSGALLLDESRDPGSMPGRAGKLALLLAFWSGFYGLVFRILLPLAAGEAISWGIFWEKLLLGHYHLWYLYVLIGLYLITPILRLFVRKENSRYILYFLLLSLIFRFSVPVGSFLLPWLRPLADRFSMGFAEPFLAYYLLGWYLTANPPAPRVRGWLYGAGAAGLLLSVLGSWCFTTEEVKAFSAFYSFESAHILGYSAAIFVFFCHRFQGKYVKSPLISTLSSLTFGVYILHELFRDLLSRCWFQGAPGYLLVPIWGIVLAVSFGAVFLLGKIPGIRKLLKL